MPKTRKNKLAALSTLVKPSIQTLWADLDDYEKLSIVCDLFLKGRNYKSIAEQINLDYRATLNRESIYPLIRKAISRKWIRYTPPLAVSMGSKLSDRYDWLIGAKIVHTSKFEDIARYGAETLMHLLRIMHHQGKNEVHIGLSGGHAMRKVADHFAQILKCAEGNIPSRLVLHALVAGFDVFEPVTDPNTFFTLFHSGEPFGVEYKYVGLHTPPVVKTVEYKTLKGVQGIKESYDEAANIDIIVTSATNWNDEHSTFRKYMSKSPACYDILEKQDCVGDLLWLPLGIKEPISLTTDIRAMTLFELDQLSELRNQGKHILLVLGPCAHCNRTKSEILSAVLNQKKKLITHLVADSRSVREVLVE
jgi:DNA-binding transcriptional regulator LsrR (DeoR family)